MNTTHKLKSNEKMKEQFLERLDRIILYVLDKEFELAQEEIDIIEDQEIAYKEFRESSYFYQICFLRTFLELEQKQISSFWNDKENSAVCITSDSMMDLLHVYWSVASSVERDGEAETMFTLYLKEATSISWGTVNALIKVTGDMYELTNDQSQIVFLLYALCCDFILDDYSEQDSVINKIVGKLNECSEYEFICEEIVFLKKIIMGHFNISNTSSTNQLLSDLDGIINIITNK